MGAQTGKGAPKGTPPKPQPAPLQALLPNAPESVYTTADDLVKLANRTQELASDVAALTNTVADRLLGHVPDILSQSLPTEHGGLIGAHETILHRINGDLRHTQQVLEFIMEALK